MTRQGVNYHTMVHILNKSEKTVKHRSERTVNTNDAREGEKHKLREQ